MKKAVLLLPFALLLVGCKFSVDPGKQGEPVDVSGKVTVGGRPLNDVTMNFQTTGEGAQAAFPIKNGEFKGQMFPGKYTYYISEGSKPDAFKVVPEKYRAGSMERQLDINSSTGPLDLKLD